jgi:MOSC domain
MARLLSVNVGVPRDLQWKGRTVSSAQSSFSENLTVEGLPDDAVGIGDRYQIGSALLRVSMPVSTPLRDETGKTCVDHTIEAIALVGRC